MSQENHIFRIIRILVWVFLKCPQTTLKDIETNTIFDIYSYSAALISNCSNFTTEFRPPCFNILIFALKFGLYRAAEPQ